MPVVSQDSHAALSVSLAAAADALAELGREFAQSGWVPASSGNLSLRLGPDMILMTRSGVEKGCLRASDFLPVLLSEPIPPGASAEAPLHAERYRSDGAIGCVLHVHSRAAAVLSRLVHARGLDHIALSGWELQKAIAGQINPKETFLLPVFDNEQDTVALARQVAARLEDTPKARAYVLAGHGLYTWGRDAAEARRHVVALDTLLQSELDVRSAS